MVDSRLNLYGETQQQQLNTTTPTLPTTREHVLEGRFRAVNKSKCWKAFFGVCVSYLIPRALRPCGLHSRLAHLYVFVFSEMPKQKSEKRIPNTFRAAG